jgi:enoyl-CoA hydratase/carnithine racemase
MNAPPPEANSTERETLLYEEADGVAVVTLNRPESHNAFNQKMRAELIDVWTGLRRNDDVRCIVLTGTGDKAFCTGVDRKETLDNEPPVGPDGQEQLRGFGSTPFMFDDPGDRLGPKSNDLWKPVIGAVNGIACGGAFYMLGEVDFIIAAEHATFFDPHVTYGMAASYEPLHIFHKLPFPELARMALLGAHERLSAQRAYNLGMVTEVVPGPELLDSARQVAARIASAPALAIQATLRALWSGLENSRSQALHEAYAYVAMGTTNASLEEGQKRFGSGRIDWRLR